MSRIKIVREAANPTRPRGLPGPLPPGETLLWQGSPAWRPLARRALHIRAFAFYFAVIATITAMHAASTGTPGAWFSLLAVLILAPIALGVIAGLAYAIARTSIYTVTDRRVVLRSGIALTASINLPFKAIDAAEVKLYRDGTGDIPLRLQGRTRIGMMTLWPHVRPWRPTAVEPMLRSIPDAAAVARTLSQALCDAAEQAAPTPVATPGPEPVRKPASGVDLGWAVTHA